MNNATRKRIDELERELRATLKEIGAMKMRESANFSARCPNGVEYHPATWSALDDAEGGLNTAIVSLMKARRSPGFGVVRRRAAA